MRFGIIIFVICICTGLLILAACKKSAKKGEFKNIKTVADLEKHSDEFKKRIEKVTDGVYSAIGYGLANSILLEGKDGVIIVDTLESIETATAVRTDFAKITDKPVKAVIYTHNHADHVFGASAFVDNRDIPVYAHSTTSAEIDRILSVLRPIITKRSIRMFGSLSDDNAIVNAGIGFRLNLSPESTIGIVRPTRTFDDRLSDGIAGIRFELIHAPGETDDQVIVWLPDKKVLLPGDNIYKTFPNLYTIRGTAYRDVNQWVKSIDLMRALGAEYLVPSHTGPVSGADKIYQILTDYRDAIAYVHDQTIRGINTGLTPDELVDTIKLPEHLASSPYLAEFYGTVEWSIRSIFNGYLGWFDGNPATLFPLSPAEHAREMASLAGGTEKLMDHAESAFESGNLQWALELTDHLLRLAPSDKKVIELRVRILTALGEKQSNPNARHYYLTCAAELGQGLVIGQQGKPTPEMVHSLPTAKFFESMAVNLDPKASADEDMTVGFVFPDSGEAYSIHVRRGVAEITPGLAADRAITVTVPSTIFKEMLAKLRSPLPTIATQFTIDGGKIKFLKFMAMFDPEYKSEL